MCVTHKNDVKQSNRLEPLLKTHLSHSPRYSQQRTLRHLPAYKPITYCYQKPCLAPFSDISLPWSTCPKTRANVLFPNYVLFHIWFFLPRWIYSPVFTWRTPVPSPGPTPCTSLQRNIFSKMATRCPTPRALFSRCDADTPPFNVRSMSLPLKTSWTCDMVEVPLCASEVGSHRH